MENKMSYAERWKLQHPTVEEQFLNPATIEKSMQEVPEEEDNITQAGRVLFDALAIPMAGIKMVGDVITDQTDDNPSEGGFFDPSSYKESFNEFKQDREVNRKKLDAQRKYHYTYLDKVFDDGVHLSATFLEYYFIGKFIPKLPFGVTTNSLVKKGATFKPDIVTTWGNAFIQNTNIGAYLSGFSQLKNYVFDDEKIDPEKWAKDSVKMGAIGTVLQAGIGFAKFKYHSSKYKAFKQAEEEVKGWSEGKWEDATQYKEPATGGYSPKTSTPNMKPEPTVKPQNIYKDLDKVTPSAPTKATDFYSPAKEIIKGLGDVTKDLSNAEVDRLVGLVTNVMYNTYDGIAKNGFDVEKYFEQFLHLDDYKYIDAQPFSRELQEPFGIDVFNTNNITQFKAKYDFANEHFDLEGLDYDMIENHIMPEESHTVLGYLPSKTFRNTYYDKFEEEASVGVTPNTTTKPKPVRVKLSKAGNIITEFPSNVTDYPLDKVEVVPIAYEIPNGFIEEDDWIGFNEDEDDFGNVSYNEKYLTDDFVYRQVREIQDIFDDYIENGVDMPVSLGRDLYDLFGRDFDSFDDIGDFEDELRDLFLENDEILSNLYEIKKTLYRQYKENYMEMFKNSNETVRVRKKQLLSDLYYKLNERGFTDEELEMFGIRKDSGQIKMLINLQKLDMMKNPRMEKLGIALDEIIKLNNLNYADFEQLANENADYEQLARFLLRSKYTDKAVDDIIGTDMGVSNRLKSELKYKDRMDKRIHQEFRNYLELGAWNYKFDNSAFIFDKFVKPDEIRLTTEYLKHLEEQMLLGDRTGIYFTGRYAMLDVLGKNLPSLDHTYAFKGLENYFDDDYEKTEGRIQERSDVAKVFENRNPATRTTVIYHSTTSDLYGALIEKNGLKGNPHTTAGYRGPAFALSYERGLEINKKSVSRNGGSKTSVGGVIVKMLLPDEEYYHIVNDSALEGAFNWGDVEPSKRNTTVLSEQYIQSIVSIDTGAILYKNEDVFKNIQLERMKNLQDGNNKVTLAKEIKDTKEQLETLKRTTYENYKNAVDKDAYMNELRRRVVDYVDFPPENFKKLGMSTLDLITLGKDESEMDFEEWEFYKKVVGRPYMNYAFDKTVSSKELVHGVYNKAEPQIIPHELEKDLVGEVIGTVPSRGIINKIFQEIIDGKTFDDIRAKRNWNYALDNLVEFALIKYGDILVDKERAISFLETNLNFLNNITETKAFIRDFIDYNNQKIIDTAQEEYLQLRQEYNDFKEVFTFGGYQKLKSKLAFEYSKDTTVLDDPVDKLATEFGYHYISQESNEALIEDLNYSLESITDGLATVLSDDIMTDSIEKDYSEWRDWFDENVGDELYTELFTNEEIDYIVDKMTDMAKENDFDVLYMSEELFYELPNIVNEVVQNKIALNNDEFINMKLYESKEKVKVAKMKGFMKLRKKLMQEAREKKAKEEKFNAMPKYEQETIKLLENKKIEHMRIEMNEKGTNVNKGVTEQDILSSIYRKATYLPFKLIMSLSGGVEFTGNHITGDILSARLMDGRTTLFNALGNYKEFNEYFNQAFKESPLIERFKGLNELENPTFMDYYRFLDDSLLGLQYLSASQQEAYAKLNLSVSLKANATKDWDSINNYIRLNLKNAGIDAKEWDEIRGYINTHEWNLNTANNSKLGDAIDNILIETTVDKMKELRTPMTGNIKIDSLSFLKSFFFKTLQKFGQNTTSFIDEEGNVVPRFSREGAKDFGKKLTKPSSLSFLLETVLGLGVLSLGGIVSKDIMYTRGTVRERLLRVKNDVKHMFVRDNDSESMINHWAKIGFDASMTVIGGSALFVEGQDITRQITSKVMQTVDKYYNEIKDTDEAYLSREEKWLKYFYATSKVGMAFLFGAKSVVWMDNLNKEIEEYVHGGLIDGSDVEGYYTSNIKNSLQFVEDLVRVDRLFDGSKEVAKGNDAYLKSLLAIGELSTEEASTIAMARRLSSPEEFEQFLKANNYERYDIIARTHMDTQNISIKLDIGELPELNGNEDKNNSIEANPNSWKE